MNSPRTIASAQGNVAAALSDAGFDEARRRARRLLAIALGLTPEEVFAQLDRVIAEDEGERIAAVLRRALMREPPSRIQGVRAFWNLEFALSSDTLDPRPETETIVEAVIARLPKRDRAYRILDLGTGTGCLLLALLSEYPQASGLGVDRSFGAASTAKGNAERLGFTDRTGFAVGDWGAAIDGKFDAVVANPPYIETAEIPCLPSEVRDFDPVLALDGGVDGLDAYGRIARDLSRLIAPGGLFACEIGAGQDAAVAQILATHGLAVDMVVPDLAGIPRCVVARPSP
jgi:release factor glutamine methyltransferase